MKLQEMVRQHFEHWPETEVPALGGQTPFQAVATAEGREMVEVLVLDAERHGRRMHPPFDGAIFQRLRERLGLTQRH